MNDDSKLVEEYRAAWAKYELSLQQFQSAADRGDRSHLETLPLSIETARLNFSAARDRLAAETLQVDVTTLAPTAAESRIRGAAQLLWELSGRPQGTAEFDWLRAERIVRHAGATTG